MRNARTRSNGGNAVGKARLVRVLPWVSAIAAIVIAVMLVVITMQLRRIGLSLADIDLNTR